MSTHKKVSVGEAAKIAQRSRSTILRAIRSQELEAEEISAGERSYFVIPTESLGHYCARIGLGSRADSEPKQMDAGDERAGALA